MSVTLRSFVGNDILPVIDALAALRLEVFRDWPYLYDGDLDYERRYLADYARGATLVVGAFDGEDMVGASTGMPLSDHADDFADAFDGSGININKVFYCAESVLKTRFRGLGVGHRFFDLREDHARDLGFTFSTFCAVLRPDDHPLRPASYRPLDAFWTARGYTPLPGVIAQFSWRDIGDDAPSEKPLQFWNKTL